MSVVVGEGLGLQVNKFEQVSSDDHQMSIAGGGVREQVPKSDVGWEGVVPSSAVLKSGEGVGGGYPTYSMMDVILLPPPPDSLRKHCLPAASFSGGNEEERVPV